MVGIVCVWVCVSSVRFNADAFCCVLSNNQGLIRCWGGWKQMKAHNSVSIHWELFRFCLVLCVYRVWTNYIDIAPNEVAKEHNNTEKPRGGRKKTWFLFIICIGCLGTTMKRDDHFDWIHRFVLSRCPATYIVINTILSILAFTSVIACCDKNAFYNKNIR